MLNDTADLTPIRVRGKRRRHPVTGQAAPQAPHRVKRSRQSFVQDSSHATNTTLQPRTPKRSLSGLESLPSEILQIVFLHCLNINLPLTSPHIARALSDNVMFTACAKAWLRSPVTNTQELAAEHDSTIDAARHSQLTLLLSRRWMTWPLLQSILTQLEDEYNAANPPPPPSPSSTEKATLPSPVSLLNFTDLTAQPKLPFLDMPTCISIPTRLLHGPWSSQRVRFLRYLLHLGLGISWSASTAGETATTGLSSAISESCPSAVSALTDPHFDIAVPVITAHLHLATVQCGCNPPTVTALLRSAIAQRAHALDLLGSGRGSEAEVNVRDPAVWSWLARLERVDARKAVWLRRTLGLAGEILGRCARLGLEEAIAEFERGVGEVGT